MNATTTCYSYKTENRRCHLTPVRSGGNGNPRSHLVWIRVLGTWKARRMGVAVTALHRSLWAGTIQSAGRAEALRKAIGSF